MSTSRSAKSDVKILVVGNPANTNALSERLAALGQGPADLARLYRTFTANADAFRKESTAHEHDA